MNPTILTTSQYLKVEVIIPNRYTYLKREIKNEVDVKIKSDVGVKRANVKNIRDWFCDWFSFKRDYNHMHIEKN